MKRPARLLWLIPTLALGGVFWLIIFRKSPAPPEVIRATVASRVQEFGLSADARLRPDFERASAPYPPSRFAIWIFKAEKRLELYAPDSSGQMRWIKSYPILAASGISGPKLREGDLQVPEGFYAIESLNPNSRFHLSLRINYPNAEDRARAAAEGRDLENLGGDIMIHGGAVSIGCLAMGDPAIEEIFILAARTGHEAIDVFLSPVDFRSGAGLPDHGSEWVGEIYRRLRSELERYPESGS